MESGSFGGQLLLSGKISDKEIALGFKKPVLGHVLQHDPRASDHLSVISIGFNPI